MRPQLFTAGILIALMGAAFYVVVLPISFAWSIPFVIAGGVMSLVSFFLPPSPGPVQPPEGYRFCVFCSTSVLLSSERCQHCNGLQPKA